MYHRLGEQAILIDDHLDRYDAFMVVLNSMFTNLVFVRLAMVLGGGVWKMPFHEGCTGDVWDVVQIDYLQV